MGLDQVAKIFGSNEMPVLLLGGQGSAYRSGNIILKPTNDKVESEELANLVSSVVSSRELRIPRPIKSINNNWIEENYVAWEFLEGKEIGLRYEQKIQICEEFSQIFKNIGKPSFIELRNDPWSIADRVTWEEKNKQYDARFQKMINQIKSKLKPIRLNSQIIHGDIARNIIFSKEYAPGVIDLTIYWRPKDYAKALLIVDAITWENTDTNIYKFVKDLPEINQLLLRAGLRRLIENPEHIEHFGKDIHKALFESKKYFNTLKLLKLL